MRRYLDRIGDEFLLRFTLVVMIIGGLLAFFAENIFISVPPGHVGVLWSRLFGGTMTGDVYREGMHIILPWDTVTLYDVRAQNRPQTLEAITLDGLHVTLTLDVRYHLIIDQVGHLQRHLGPDYANVVLSPTAASFARSQVARYTAEELYSTHRPYIERVILDFMRQNHNVMLRDGVTGLSFINYDAALINDVHLPDQMRRAIENKLIQQEVTEEWVYRIRREQLESERRTIEAQATRTVLNTLGDSLTDTFVRLRYVEMLERLATSPNTKIIVTGPGGAPPALMVGADTAGAGGAAPVVTGEAGSPPLVLPVPPSLIPPVRPSDAANRPITAPPVVTPGSSPVPPTPPSRP